MQQKHHSTEEIIRILRQADTDLGGPQYLAHLGCEYLGMYKVFRA